MTIYIFLGPSLSHDYARTILDATYLPPIQQGDLARLLLRKPRYVGIIDGYFETVPAVWHKEILLALSQGVHVFGAASMGALRAAELHAFGMIGVGQIFQWFSDETLVADDEVAVRHGPAGIDYLPLNQSLVDIRDCCARARADGILTAHLADRIIAAATSLPFPERSWSSAAAAIADPNPDEANALATWQDYALNRYVSLKSRDAQLLLEQIKVAVSKPWRPHKPCFELQHTIFLERLLNQIALENVRAMLPAISEDQRPQTMERLRRAALLRLVAREQALPLGWEPTDAEISDRAAALWSAFAVKDTDAAVRWMTRHGVSEQMLRDYLIGELLVDRLANLHGIGVERELPLQLLISHSLQAAEPAGDFDPSDE
jgi:hypothetical protein